MPGSNLPGTSQSSSPPATRRRPGPLVALAFLLALAAAAPAGPRPAAAAGGSGTAAAAFAQAARESGVPAPLLQALCYQEGRLSEHGGSPSVDNGYGCMHLVQNANADTLDQAATDLHAPASRVRTDLATNIRGGAAVLRDEALGLGGTHALPAALGDWYGAVAAYSHATTRATALMYADAVYAVLARGFSAPADGGETVTLAARAVTPNRGTAAAVRAATALPAGCADDGNVDFPGAVDCIVPPATFDCNLLPATAPCSYNGANRPADFAIRQVVIHDVEGTAQDALNVFQDPNRGVSVQYIVDSDGTIFQTLHEKDVQFGAGNFWYNEHTVNIEHAGFDATGFLWYNATQYLASARLVAHLLSKYGIPLDHDHVIGHSDVPGPNLANTPNHVDPGPYWLWTYYLGLIHEQGVPRPEKPTARGTVSLRPSTDRRPLGRNGTETPANLNFFYLFQGPSTRSGPIVTLSEGTDITDVSGNVETQLGYRFLARVRDPAGTGSTMYQVWYGEFDQAHANPKTVLQTAHQAWLAVPDGAAEEGAGAVVTVSGPAGAAAEVFGRPTTSESFHVGDAPSGAIFVSAFTVVEDGTSNVWYEINFNHRQAWVPAAEVTVSQTT